MLRRLAWLVASCTGAALVVGALITPAQAAPTKRAPSSASSPIRFPLSGRAVALTFDDGPDPRWTPRVLALLAAHHAHATFFVTGRNAYLHAALLRAELAAGDEIANHTLDHPLLTVLGAAQARREVRGGAAVIRALGAPPPRWFRPPYGQATRSGVEAAAAQGERMVLWSWCVERYVDHEDAALGLRAMIRGTGPGDIILAHDGGLPDRRRTMQALPVLLDELAHRGFHFVTLAQLEVMSRTRAEHDVRHAGRRAATPAPSAALTSSSVHELLDTHELR